MLRPRDGHDLRLLDTKLDITPAGTSKWVYDVLGNSVTIVSFTASASELRFSSRLTIERYGSRPPRGEVDSNAATYPFIYSMQDRSTSAGCSSSTIWTRRIASACGRAASCAAPAPTRWRCWAT